ncbi:hypothetical protein [Saccharothrix obliqua]|uniref:hypothetical protein n=1 Tax=Saccharothrix obliqua TaxID=2861747 RepID=UPI001C5DBB42|nr:hypothetical protein [Saccharothrix obliqua]MBW4717252.1 hypothetical protein [Saccharothrix obliqua]
MGQDHRDVVTNEQGTQIRMILRYEHRRDSQDAHCLARLVLREPPLPPVAVFTEIRSNPRGRTLGYFDRPAEALRAAVGDSVDVPWDEVVWVQHFGEFSAWYVDGAPEEFVVADLLYFNGHYHDEVKSHRDYRAAEFRERYGDLGLDPVPETVRALGWKF